MYWGYHYWGMHLFWWLFWIALIAVLLSTGWPRSRVNASDRAIDTLRGRYAAGEIDETEYHQRLAVLRGTKSPVATTTSPIASSTSPVASSTPPVTTSTPPVDPS